MTDQTLPETIGIMPGVETTLDHRRHDERRAGGASEPPAPARPVGAEYLFHPAIDFMLVGGLSIIVALLVFFVMENKSAALPTAMLVGFVLSDFINYPHFAHSYQILYGGIGRRMFGPDTTQKIRLKYIWAGFVAPSIIAGFLIAAYLFGDIRTLGYAANAMLFFVGWHYVMQGYGVLIVLSVVRRIFYMDREKRLLLLNGYAVWIYSWMALNDALSEESLFGVKYLTLAIPHLLLTIAALAAGATTLAVCLAFGHRAFIRKEPVSWNGALGYGCALYLWVIARYIDPIYVIFVPAFHSLQYLLFVWRYQLNKLNFQARAKIESRQTASARPARNLAPLRFAVFVALGIAFGWLGFIGIPNFLQRELAPDVESWGPTVFVFMFAIWINIHHYFIDNVIWRKDNDDVRRFLFAPR